MLFETIGAVRQPIEFHQPRLLYVELGHSISKKLQAISGERKICMQIEIRFNSFKHRIHTCNPTGLTSKGDTYRISIAKTGYKLHSSCLS